MAQGVTGSSEARLSEPSEVSATRETEDESVVLAPVRQRGKIYIEDDVISIITRIAAEHVEGVHQIGESSFRNIFSRLTRHHGVDAEAGLEEAAADIEIVVELGYSIKKVAEEIREKVIETVESMTGREMVEVNIYVVDVHVPKANATRRTRRELE